MKMALGRAWTADSLKALGRFSQLRSLNKIVRKKKNCLAAASTLLLLNIIVQVNVVRLFVTVGISLILPLVFDQFGHPSESLVHVDLILQIKLI